MHSSWLVDPRLLGTWCSDAELTLAEWQFSPGASAMARESLTRSFGKLRMRYTAARVFTEFGTDRTACPYRVVATDESSVAIVRRTEGRNEIQHVHFAEPGVHWVSVGRNREFFRRVEV
jgi:hypothetical protein